MRARRLLTLVVGFGTVAAACAPTAGDETTVPAVEGSIQQCDTELDRDVSGDNDLEPYHVAYLSQIVAVPSSQVEQLQDAGILGEEIDVDELLGEAGSDHEEVAQARACLRRVLRMFTVNGDPREVAQQARADNPGVLIAPIHAIGEAGHVGFKSGTDPEVVDDRIDPPGDAPADADLAAVVDSGIYPETPGLGDNVEMISALDQEPASDVHSHGTFVSSIIRQLSPEHRITFARAGEIPIDEFSWSDAAGRNTDLTALTSELHVAEAILRLVHRHQDEPERVKSLNLSLGAYSPLLEDDLALTSIFVALDIWSKTFPEAPVFAAGGNDAVADPVLPFWPGALETVTAVGALNDPAEGTPVEIVWHDPDQDGQAEEVAWSDITNTPRRWIEPLAPGSMLVNYTQPEVIAHWSGSSFASAVANGLHLRGETSIPQRRSQVAGLTYWDGTQVLP